MKRALKRRSASHDTIGKNSIIVKKRTSIKDIAGKLGVSTTLVSFVLNGKGKEKRVSAAMAAKIVSTAREMHYSPNQIARSLRKGATNTIGLIVADIANPFFGVLARTIEDEAGKHGFDVLIGSSDEDRDKSASLIEIFLNRQVDGFIIVPVEGTEEQIDTLQKTDIPVVLVDRYFPAVQSVSHVVLDNFRATYDATAYLAQKGYRKTGLIAYESSMVHVSERIRGYEEAMKAAGLEKNITVMRIPYTFTAGMIENAINVASFGPIAGRCAVLHQHADLGGRAPVYQADEHPDPWRSRHPWS